jgi:CBS domain-containing protein
MNEEFRRREVTMKTLEDVMTSPVVTARIEDRLGPVRDYLLEAGIGCVPILGAGGELRGIVTATDVMEQWDHEQSVTSVMSSPVMTADPAMTTVTAARLMLDNRLHHVVVVGDDVVVGVVSSFDLLRELAGDVEAAVAAEDTFLYFPGSDAEVQPVVR